MHTLYSNGAPHDFVMGIYQTLIAESSTLFVASPFVMLTDEFAK
jgi:hypothetical protein